MADVFDKFGNFRSRCESTMEEQHNEVDLDMRFYHNKKSRFDATLYDSHDNQIVNMPHVKPIIDSVSGLFRQIRREVSYSARSDSDEQRMELSEVMTSAGRAMDGNAGMEYLESDQDQMMLIAGVAPMEMGIHFRDDAQGSFIGENIDPRFFYFDPLATDRNLLSAEFQYYKKIMSLKFAQSMFPGTNEEDFESAESVLDTGTPRDKDRGRPAYTIELGRSKKGDSSNTTDYVSVTNLQWRELETVNTYKNPAFITQDSLTRVQAFQALTAARDELQAIMKESGEFEEGFETDFNPQAETLVIPKKHADIIEWLLSFFGGDEALKFDQRDRWVYHQAFMGQKETLKTFKALDQQGHSAKVKTGFRDPESSTWYGMTRQMREPDMYLNKIQTVQLLILAKRAKDGVLVETGGMYSKEDIEDGWADGVVLELPDGAVSGNKIRSKVEMSNSTGYEDMYNAFLGSPARAVSINPEFLGQSDAKDVSGILEQTRIRQVTSSLANYTDSISLFQTEKGRAKITYLRFLAKINGEFIVSVAGEDGAERVLKVTSGITDIDYGVELGEAQLSPAMKEAAFVQIKEIAFMLLQTKGDDSLLPEMIMKMDVYGLTKAEVARIIKAIKPEPDPEQEQLKQQALQLELQEKQIDISGKEADVGKTVAQTQEIGINVAKTEAEADKVEAETSKIPAEIEKLIAERVKIVVETELARRQPLTETNVVL